MKRSTIISVIILAIMVLPFKYAYLTPATNNMTNMVSFLIVVIGFMAIMTITSFGKDSKESR